MNKPLHELLAVVYDDATAFQPGFDRWLQDNLPIFESVVAQARKVRARGFQHYAIATLWEVARYHTNLAEKDGSFKLNNNWKADVAQLILLAYPEEFPADFFELRRRTMSLGCYRPKSQEAA